jgi:hypothetical protein
VFAIAGFSRNAAADDLETGFVHPPDSARPHTWWHWMNGNISKEGITADLEAMARVGVGGAQIFNAREGIPHGPIQFNGPEWLDMVKHAAKEASRLGLELCIHNCAGWSSSGGPWNTPEHGMKVVVTSETRARGPSRFEAKLARPPAKLDFYRDIAVLAFPTPAGERVAMRDLAPRVTAGSAGEEGSAAADGKVGTSLRLDPPKPDAPRSVLFEFPRPFAARRLIFTPGLHLHHLAPLVRLRPAPPVRLVRPGPDQDDRRGDRAALIARRGIRRSAAADGAARAASVESMASNNFFGSICFIT